MGSARSEGRQRGRIETRGKTLRVVVHAGTDPVTGKRSYIRETINGTGKAAYKRAERALNKLLSQVDDQRSAPSSVEFSFALREWMRTNEIEESARHTYQGYIDRTIRPALGDLNVNEITPREDGTQRQARGYTTADLRAAAEEHRTNEPGTVTGSDS